MSRNQTSPVAVEAKFDGRRWRVTTSRAGRSDVTEEDRAEAARTINPRLTAMRERLAAMPEPWLQELLLEGYLDRMTALYVAERFAAQALADPSQTHRRAGPPAEVCPEMIAAALARAGTAARLPWATRLRGRAHHLAAATLALLAFATLALRTASWPSRLPAGKRRVAAIHAEKVNRTRHVLAELAQLDPADSAMLVVGRPQIGRRAIEVLLRDHGWAGSFVFTLDLRAALGGLPKGLHLLRQASRALRTAGLTLQARDQIAANFRILLGAANTAWADRQPFERDATIVFGHSGRADTTSLERAVQRRGVRTAHWVHGLSVGHAYTGVADLAIWQCVHDAEWHDRLEGYRRNMAFPVPEPVFVPGPADRRWLVMTNFTHYGYTFFASAGAAHEFRLIDEIEQVVDRLGLAPADVTWKPHPVFWQRDPEIRRIVLARLAQAGFDVWPENDRDVSRSLTYGTIVTTPSGIGVDMLKLGRLPVMAQFHEVDPEHALAKFLLRGHDADSLIAAALLARDPARARPIFSRTWQAVRPARAPGFAQIEAEAART